MNSLRNLSKMADIDDMDGRPLRYMVRGELSPPLPPCPPVHEAGGRVGPETLERAGNYPCPH